MELIAQRCNYACDVARKSMREYIYFFLGKHVRVPILILLFFLKTTNSGEKLFWLPSTSALAILENSKIYIYKLQKIMIQNSETN
jgi:hypothetical protein